MKNMRNKYIERLHVSSYTFTIRLMCSFSISFVVGVKFDKSNTFFVKFIGLTRNICRYRMVSMIVGWIEQTRNILSVSTNKLTETIKMNIFFTNKMIIYLSNVKINTWTG